MGIIELLKKEHSYWLGVKESTKNRLVCRVAESNINRCCYRIFRLTHKVKVISNEDQ